MPPKSINKIKKNIQFLLPLRRSIILHHFAVFPSIIIVLRINASHVIFYRISIKSFLYYNQNKCPGTIATRNFNPLKWHNYQYTPQYLNLFYPSKWLLKLIKISLILSYLPHWLNFYAIISLSSDKPRA